MITSQVPTSMVIVFYLVMSHCHGTPSMSPTPPSHWMGSFSVVGEEGGRDHHQHITFWSWNLFLYQFKPLPIACGIHIYVTGVCLTIYPTAAHEPVLPPNILIDNSRNHTYVYFVWITSVHIPSHQRSRVDFCKHLACNLGSVLSEWEHVVITSGPAYNEFGYKEHFAYGKTVSFAFFSCCKGDPV